MLSGFCKPEENSLSFRNSLDSLILRLSDAISASVRNSKERNNELKRVQRKRCPHGYPGEARASDERRENEGMSEAFCNGKREPWRRTPGGEERMGSLRSSSRQRGGEGTRSGPF